MNLNVYHFSGRNDLMKFINYVKKAGLYLILRMGPYVCGEWNYGGFPVWLHNLPGIEFRTDNEVFPDEMANFTTLIVNMVKDNHLFASQGGPIILAQWCANLAQSLNIGVPWVMCQQDDAPAPMIPTCNGYYCDGGYPQRNNVPKMWTENWTGWFKGWGSKVSHRPAEDLAFTIWQL
ncbi:hypothetical protein C1H46_032221 [Malus baccata]|uniref:beta-galactosidase n=1 Tax=Malus baccata TaxID=106549 RepID=A0A540L6U7_MALBA|nr:hypothetical protein C1H46_032221 [Malus baccata]